MNFLCHERVSKGAESIVERGSSDGVPVAKKILRFDRGEGLPSRVVREVAILRTLAASTGIVKLLDVAFSPDSVLLYLEGMDCDLQEDIKRLSSEDVKMDDKRALKIVSDLADGLAFCHFLRIVHRDIKPANILIRFSSGGVEAKLADFGLGRFLDDRMTRDVVTLWYRCPEIIMGGADKSIPYGTEADIWSLACSFAEIALTGPLFPGSSEIHVLFLHFRRLGTPSSSVGFAAGLPGMSKLFPQWKGGEVEPLGQGESPEWLWNLVRDCVVLDPARRLDARTLRERCQQSGRENVAVVL